MVSFIVPGAGVRQSLRNGVRGDCTTQRESDAEDAAIALF